VPPPDLVRPAAAAAPPVVALRLAAAVVLAALVRVRVALAGGSMTAVAAEDLPRDFVAVAVPPVPSVDGEARLRGVVVAADAAAPFVVFARPVPAFALDRFVATLAMLSLRFAMAPRGRVGDPGMRAAPIP
jgi:hypothetical protein